MKAAFVGTNPPYEPLQLLIDFAMDMTEILEYTPPVKTVLCPPLRSEE